MAVSQPCLCTREDVAQAQDIKETARSAAQIDRAIEAAVDSVSGLLHRSFIPWTGTRTFDWPDPSGSRSWRLWLRQNELVSVSAIVAGGVTFTSGQYFLRPDEGPPFTHVEVNLGGAAAFASDLTHQRAVSITGVYAHSARTAPAGALAEALDATETAVDVTDSSVLGVGDMLLVDSERMTVIGKRMLDTGVDIDAADSLTVSAADVSITLSTAVGAPLPDEVILIDSERMLVIDVAGLVVTVKRAWDGSALAAHAGGSSIYAPRTLTVLRGEQGTTAATHALAAPVLRHAVPALVRQLAIGEAINWMQQEGSGYARTAGSGDNEREVNGKGLALLRDQARTAFGRQARTEAI